MGISANINDFKRTAIVFKMIHEKPHNNIAYECFHYGETLALLPLTNNTASIVMTIPTEESENMMKTNDKIFNHYISNKFKKKFGKMRIVSKRFIYPLTSVYAEEFIKCRYALIGDAAVSTHPVTAHGFNLGLRSQNTLYLQIQSALKHGLDIGSLIVLKKYQSKHRLASKPLYLGTNAIVKLYTNNSLFSKFIRKTMLRIGNNFMPAKTTNY